MRSPPIAQQPSGSDIPRPLRSIPDMCQTQEKGIPLSNNLRTRILLGAVAVVAVSFPLQAAKLTTPTKTARSLTNRGTSQFVSSVSGMNTNGPEFAEMDIKNFADQTPAKSPQSPGVDPTLTIPIVAGKQVSAPVGLAANFPGLNHFVERTSDGGNQFSLEPPDMGLAVGNGFVLQAVNLVMNIYDVHGTPLITAASLNEFFYHEHAVWRGAPPAPPPGHFGHSISDPTVYFDHDTQRWFLTVITFDVNPATGAELGTDHIDIAVSSTPNPTGLWKLYQIDASQDGFLCSLADFGPCFGDFPHVGADANGFYVTTNSFGFFNFGGYRGVNIYGFPKSALAANASSISGVLYSALVYDTGEPAFAVMPATTPIAGQYDTDNGGTEFFMTALDLGAIYDNRVAIIGMTNTSALNFDPLQTQLGGSILLTQTYGDPLKAAQKVGNIPLGDLVYGRPEGVLDASDSRVTQCVYANGKLFGSNTSRLQVGSDPTPLSGAAFYIFKPRVTGGSDVGGALWRQGYVAVASNNLIYSSIGVTQSGKGVMTFTLVGPDHYPSSAYALVDKVTGIPGDVRVAAEGVGPQDGFTEYADFFGPGLPRPRWGDYSAATFDGDSIWWAAEYIGQTCTDAQFAADTTCGGTRTLNANWGTFISEVRP